MLWHRSALSVVTDDDACYYFCMRRLINDVKIKVMNTGIIVKNMQELVIEAGVFV